MTELNKIFLTILLFITFVFVSSTWHRLDQLDLDLNLNKAVEIVDFKESSCTPTADYRGRNFRIDARVFYWYKFNNSVYGSSGIAYDDYYSIPYLRSLQDCEHYLLELKKLQYTWIDPKKPLAAFLINKPPDFSDEIRYFYIIVFLYVIFLLNLFWNKRKSKNNISSH